MEYFPLRLKWLREKNGYSQREMADHLGISQPYYGRFEKGTGEPNLVALYRMRKLFNESLDFLVGVFIEDLRAESLYDLYMEVRDEREDLEELIKEYTEYQEEDKDSKETLEWRLKTILKYKDELKKLKSKEENAINLFVEYVNTIPGVDKEHITKEFWINEYKQKKADQERATQEYGEILDKL